MQSMKQFYLIVAGISLLSCVSCNRRTQGSEKEQTVKTDTVVPAEARAFL